MSSPLLALGSFLFQGLECPDRILSYAAQRLVTHQTAAGGKVFDNLGVGIEALRFSGIFSGPLAIARADELETLRIAGNPIPLVWSGTAVTVLIHQLRITYLSPTLLPFTLICLPVAGPDGPDAIIDDPLTQLGEADIPLLTSNFQTIGITLSGPQDAALAFLASRKFDSPPAGDLATAQAVRIQANQAAIAADQSIEANPLRGDMRSGVDARLINGLEAVMRTAAHARPAEASVGSIVVGAQDVWL